MVTAEQVAAMHPAPPVTDSKIRRLRLLAVHGNPKIRESVASSYNTPADLFETLSHDTDEGVRACVARNEAAPCDVLRELSHDASPTVRGWVAVNFYVPDDVMQELAEDVDPTVRSLVAWKSALAAESDAAESAQLARV